MAASTVVPEQEDWGGEYGIPGGDREWQFCQGALKVRAYEDFVEGAIGGIVTRASIELSRFVAEEAPSGTWTDLLCVELGSGCGLVSGTLVQLGARVVATEQPEFLEHLRYNLELNSPPSSASTACATASKAEAVSRCEPVDWSSDPSRRILRAALGGGADVIVGANCIYAHEAVEGFLAGVVAISSPSTEVFVCGIPKPPERKADLAAPGPSMLDTFLTGARAIFDCYLVGMGGNPAVDAPTRPVGVDVDTCPSFEDVVSETGLAELLANRHNLSVGVLADGVWLMLTPGKKLPAWVRPLLKLSRIVSEQEKSVA